MRLRNVLIPFGIFFLIAPSVLADFPDVKKDDWFEPYVQQLVDEGIVQGYPNGKFGSWDPVNRAELSKIIVNLEKRLEKKEKPFWEEHLFEMILTAVTILGWGSVLWLAKRPIAVSCACSKENGVPDAVSPLEPPSPPEETLNNSKNQTTNWWM